MENSFLVEYFDFVRSIKKGNEIIAVINSDYNERNINLLIDRQNSYVDSVNKLVRLVENLSGITKQQSKELEKQILEIKKKADVLEKRSLSTNELLYHYYVMAQTRNISFIVVFKDEEYWNVNFTSSLRSDRMDTHSNRFIQTNATKNFLVVCSYPYQDASSKKCINDIKKNSSYYGSSINVVCLEEFMDELMYCIFKYKTDSSGNLVAPKLKDELSIVNGERGVQIEHMYAKILSNAKNLELYVNNVSAAEREQTSGSFFPNHFSIIVDRIIKDKRIDISHVSKIDAIPTGASGEKADVKVTITLDDGDDSNRVGISIKSSSSENVTVHEKHASDFISVLGIEDQTLKDAFIQFEKKRALSKLDRQLYSALSDYYSDQTHVKELVTWAIAGESTNPLKADYILLHSYNYNSREALGHAIKIYSCNDYINELMTSETDGSFGTHLTWTYKGNIQLKAPFMFE